MHFNDMFIKTVVLISTQVDGPFVMKSDRLGEALELQSSWIGAPFLEFRRNDVASVGFPANREY